MAKYLNLDGLQTLWAKLKDTFAPKTHTHNFTEVQEPIAEKTYTGLIASSNTNGNGADFIMIDLAHVSDTSKIFKLRVRIEASYKRSNDNVTYTSTHDCLIYGAGGNGAICSAMWNNHRNTSYRPMYYFVAYRPSTATANWKLGVCLYNCNNNTTAGNERTITMKVISQENCSATLYDSCANTDYTTYYKNMAGRTTYDCANNGLQESGDANTTTNVYANEISGYSGTTAGTAAKGIDFAQFVYTGTRVFKAYIANANTASTPTINVNGQGAKTLYLLTADNTWTAASSTVKTITAGSHWFFWNGTYMYMLPDACNSSAIPTDVAYINGQAAYATKNVFVNGAYLVKGAHFRLRVDAANTNTGNLSLNVNCKGAKPIFINGARANGTSNNLVVGWYEVVYDGTNYNAYNSDGGGIVYPEADHASSASAAKSGSALETAINAKANAASVTGATKCKVTYNSQGVITAGADLAASDIPNLASSKITSGTFADERIASASKWNGKQDDISDIIPTAASASNPLCDKAYADAIGERLEARYLGCNANGDPFATHAALTSATKFYYQGAETTPDTNDITTVIADEDHKNTSNVAGTTRYRYGGVDASGKPVWAFEYVINNTGLSQAQLLAVNSGITATKVTKYEGYATGKQDKLTEGSNISISGSTISATDTTYDYVTPEVIVEILNAMQVTE